MPDYELPTEEETPDEDAPEGEEQPQFNDFDFDEDFF